MNVVTNHQLFSHTYLTQLQADPSHDEAAAPIARGLREWMPSRDHSSVQALMDSWIGPVLDFLKFHHAPGGDASQIHLLYAHRGDETPVGLCYVVPPGQDLDDTTKGRHPMAQAVLALRARDLRWGMLTDGVRWRLVDAQGLRRYEHYVEVDLDALAHTDDPAALRLFYAFFHRSAFTPDDGGDRGLDRLVTASEKATRAAEGHLKARVSHNEGIMARLCLGLVRADGQTRYTEAERDAIYRDATYLLYRILFILYAEARGLLPMDEPAYRAVSLAELVKTAHDYKLRGMPDPQATTLWERLKRLCTAIYESDPALGIPAYNGGLFDDADKPHLRDGFIADAYLSEALFDLAYMPDTAPGTSEVPGTSYRRMDYRDLSVRHLGSLYEGMIEYRLQIAEETLWARRDSKGNVRFLRTGQDGAPRKRDVEIEPGQVYFSQSPGERRATGTYYTPEYIVDYIVRQTVWRGLEERRAPLEQKLAGWLEEIQTSEVSETSEVLRMQRTADEELLRFVEEQVLTFRACDPAMGSGHFLVNAAHQITDFIVETLHLTPWVNETTDADPVAWRRRVVEHCLYGVDLSLMAVELAKLSLWLASVAEGKPLSFLDHHLRQGNSLIGARLEDLAEVLAGIGPTKPSRWERKAREAGQLSMLDDPAFSQHMTAATDLLAQISARVAETVEDVEAQATDYEQVREELEPYRQLANLTVARHFGMDMDEQQLRDVSKYLVNGAVSPVPEYQRLLTDTQELADERHFFHWELEFTEVFFDQHSQKLVGDTGFNAVIGNPPYVSNWELTSSDSTLPAVLECLYPKVVTGHWDLYVLFGYRALSLASPSDGNHSFIVPSSLATEKYAVKLREHLLTRCKLKMLVNFGHHLVFEDVARQYLIYVASPTLPDGHVCRIVEYERGRFETVLSIPQDQFLGFSNYSLRTALSHSDLVLKSKVERVSIKLGSLCCVNVGVVAHSRAGSSVNFKKDDVIDSRDGPGREKYITGSEICRYGSDWGGLFLDYEAKREFFHRPKFPELFESPKIMVRRVSGANNAILSCYDEEQYYTNDNVIHIVLWASQIRELQSPGNYEISDQVSNYELRYIAATLNSRLITYYFASFLATGTLQGSYTGIYPEDVRKLCIRRIEFTTPADTRAALLERSQRLYGLCMVKRDPDCVIDFVEHQLSQEPEQADVIHDLLAYLAQQMIDLHKERQRLEREAKPFRFVEQGIPCLRLDKALGGPLGAGEMVGNLSAVHHDIERLRLAQEEDGRWLLEVRAKLRDPESGWREHRRDKDGNLIRRWLPAYRLPLDEATGRFYHYAFANLDGFDGVKIPGGFTRTTLQKLMATKVPKLVPVDLAPLAALEAELAEVRRRIRLTDDLIDQIVYKLYGLTEEEIAIVEGRA